MKFIYILFLSFCSIISTGIAASTEPVEPTSNRNSAEPIAEFKEAPPPLPSGCLVGCFGFLKKTVATISDHEEDFKKVAASMHTGLTILGEVFGIAEELEPIQGVLATVMSTVNTLEARSKELKSVKLKSRNILFNPALMGPTLKQTLNVTEFYQQLNKMQGTVERLHSIYAQKQPTVSQEGDTPLMASFRKIPAQQQARVIRDLTKGLHGATRMEACLMTGVPLSRYKNERPQRYQDVRSQRSALGRQAVLLTSLLPPRI